MVGRSVDQIFPKIAVPIGEELFRVDGLSRGEEFADISFTLRRGEILGVYGLSAPAAARSCRRSSASPRLMRGDIRLDGRPLHIRSPEEAIGAGIAYVPEDRQIQGGILRFPITSNIVLPSLSHLSHRGFLRRSEERALAEEYVTELQIKTSGVSQRLEELSGGNQQKVVIAKWLATNPRVLIMDEPTKGIDVGAKTAVYRLMGEMVAKGLGIIMVSSELPEVMGMADRILVMRRGRLRANFTRAEATPESIVKAATDA